MNTVYNWLNSIQECLFPPTCILCGNPGFHGLDLCQSCYLRLPRNANSCAICAEIFDVPVPENTLCGRCLRKTPAFDLTYAPFTHQEEIRYLITGLKFGKQYKNARLLGRLLAENMQLKSDKPELIIPVPLHPVRYRERGFNQALEITRTVSKTLAIPIDHHSCVRHKDTSHQTGLTAKQRQQNLRWAFSVITPIKANHIAILDDVMTTGATVNALAIELKKAGAQRVDVWVVSRA